MAPLMKLRGGIILIWILLLSAGVSSHRNDCWTFLCATHPNLNCTCKPEVPNWLVPTICLVPVLIIGICCIRMCINYCRERKAIYLSDESSMQNPPPFLMPDILSDENFDHRVPPSYSEAISKEPRYQLPLEDPPAYEDIALTSAPLSDAAILSEFMPKNNTTTV